MLQNLVIASKMYCQYMMRPHLYAISVLFVSEKSNLGLAALHYFGGCAERSNARYVSPEGAAKYHEILTMLFHFSCPKSFTVNGLLEVYFS